MKNDKAKKKAARKVHKVMHEFKQGNLHSGNSKKLVKTRSQAIAIALSEGRKASRKKK